MNVKTRNFALIGIVSALALGLVAATGVNSTALAMAGTVDNVSDNAGFMGHVVLTVYDPNGNIVQYLQTDNSITTEGENCTGEFLFGYTATGCGPVVTAFFDDIVIGTGTSNLTDTIATLQTEIDSIGGTPTEDTASAGTGGAAIAKITASTILAADRSITEAGLEEGGTSALYARQQFTALILNSGDTLTVDWLITIAG